MFVRRVGPYALLGAVAVAAACGGDDDVAPGPSSSSSSSSSSGSTSSSSSSSSSSGGSSSSSSSSSSGDASTDAGDDADAAAPFGLDTRTSNTTCLAKPRPPVAGGIKLDTPFPNLPKFTRPVLFLQAPGDTTKNYVVEQILDAGPADIKVFANDPTVSTTTDFLTLPAGFVKSGSAGEGGLLGLAFHPDWQTNHTAFITYTFDPPGGNPMATRIARVKSNDGGLTLDASTIEPILTIEKKYENHNGGNIVFGPDGNLYLGMGDGGSGGDPDNNAQNPNSLLGKMLRITVGATGAYTIPADNPYAQSGGAKEVYAIGLRNPWRWSFDRVTNELWVGDVGQNTREEIDIVKRGGNYGWRVREGLICQPPAMTCTTAGFTDPVVDYDHTLGIAVTGGFVYRGALASLAGKYIFADYGSGRMWTIDFDPTTGAASRRQLLASGPGVSSFGEDLAGEVYVVQYGGDIKKVALADPPPPDTFPKKLSETGCFEAADAKTPVAALVPFQPTSPLWSDGAEKSRWMALPDGKAITVKADGDFDFPTGTVLAKEFRLAGKRIETRIFMRHDDGEWGGYSYEWNDAGTDADLLPAGKTKTVGSVSWTYPDRAQCFSCHTEAAGRSLGPEVIQLDADLTYPSTGRRSNQLATLEHIGFINPLTAGVKALPRVVDPLVAGPTAETRARSYVHANCSICHRPGGPGRGPADFRFGTAAKDIGVCNVDPTEGDLGVAGAKLFAAGDPATSILSLRMYSTTSTRMPPLASSVVHTAGAEVIDTWITATKTCP